MSWYIENNRLTHADLPELIEPRYSPPYPSGIWYIENGRLTHSRLPQLIEIDDDKGAFFGVSSLTTAKIPKSVQTIGEKAFAGTGLTKIKISRNCTYSSTSFPEGCEIEFYESEGETNG